MCQKDRTNNRREIIRAKLNDPDVLTLFPLFGAPVSLEAWDKGYHSVKI